MKPDGLSATYVFLASALTILIIGGFYYLFETYILPPLPPVAVTIAVKPTPTPSPTPLPTPAPSYTPITSCQEIKTGGYYSLSQNLSTPSNRCLTIQNIKDVHLDCQNHTISAEQAENIWIKNVHNFSIKNCNLIVAISSANPEGGDGISIQESEMGIIENNTSTEGGLRLINSNHIQILNNTVSGHSPFNQNKSSFNQISNNKFKADPVVAKDQIPLPQGGFIGSGGTDGVLVSQAGAHNTIENNLIDGSSDGIRHNEGNIGADDGILLAAGENNDRISGNTIQNNWDCGVENIGPIHDIQITKNKINNSGVCGIGAWYWNSWLRVTVDGNVVDTAPVMLYIYRANGLLDGKDNGVVEQNMYFQDNVFSNNVFQHQKTTPDKTNISSVFIDFANIPSEIPPSQVKVGNNIFKNNDFGNTIISPTIVPAMLILDQGGNKCLKVDDNSHPLKCQ